MENGCRPELILETFAQHDDFLERRRELREGPVDVVDVCFNSDGNEVLKRRDLALEGAQRLDLRLGVVAKLLGERGEVVELVLETSHLVLVRIPLAFQIWNYLCFDHRDGNRKANRASRS